jgi:pimeloyl-ACP methyl ester carboxylesterase
LAQQFRALTPSALEVRAVLDSHEGADRLSEQPMVVVSAATCSPARLAAHERLADRSRHSSHVRACAGGHWVHLDEPEVVATAIRELVERARTDRAEASAIRRKA